MTTDTDVRIRGLRALVEALGPVEAERFIALILREPFDYTQWQRHLWTDKSVDDVSKAAMAMRSAPPNKGLAVFSTSSVQSDRLPAGAIVPTRVSFRPADTGSSMIVSTAISPHGSRAWARLSGSHSGVPHSTHAGCRASTRPANILSVDLASLQRPDVSLGHAAHA
jgi:hypothetical protein